LHIFWTGLLGVVALGWIIQAADIVRGAPTIPALQESSAAADSDCPPVSILFAARDEAEKLPGALQTMLALDYPRYEIISVDDRSEDGTGAILESAARKDARLKLARVDELPPGWLGKPHALQAAYERSGGEWLVFTDADVHFAPDVLRRSITLAERRGWEHLTLIARVEMFTFGEKILMLFFALAFAIGSRPWRTSNPRSGAYMGVGAFQLIRRSAYETIGTHRRLAMEVVDDMKLGKLVKDAGLRSGVARCGDAVRVHWHSGVGNIVRGTTKNLFAVSGFRLWLTIVQVSGVLLMFVFPLIALAFTHGWGRAFDLISIGVPLIAEAGLAIEFSAPPAYALTYPIGALIFVWMMARSAIVTMWQGGVVWRGTFYPLNELRRGVV
jgi:hypothetical protein